MARYSTTSTPTRTRLRARFGAIRPLRLIPSRHPHPPHGLFCQVWDSGVGVGWGYFARKRGKARF